LEINNCLWPPWQRFVYSAVPVLPLLDILLSSRCLQILQRCTDIFILALVPYLMQEGRRSQCLSRIGMAVLRLIPSPLTGHLPFALFPSNIRIFYVVWGALRHKDRNILPFLSRSPGWAIPTTHCLLWSVYTACFVTTGVIDKVII
jgi:hypothetical protein